MLRSLIVLVVLLLAAPAAAQSPCSPLADPEAIVRCEQQRAGGSSALEGNPTNIVTFLRQTAASLNAAGIPGGPFGILVKRSGTSCDGYACDIICSGNGGAQRQWDVLIAAGDPGGSRPTWDGPLDSIVVRPCEFVAGVPPSIPEPEPPSPQPDPELAQRIAALEAAVVTLTERIQALIDKPAPTLPPITIEFPIYEGRVPFWGGPVTLTPVKR